MELLQKSLTLKPRIRRNCYCQTQSLLLLFQNTHLTFQHFPGDTNPACGFVLWGQSFVARLRQGQVEQRSAGFCSLKVIWTRWSPLLQMHFTFSYLPPAYSSTVTDTGLSQLPCVWRQVEVRVEPAVGLDPAWQILYSPSHFSSSSTQMLQLCTAPSDENLILGYWPQTSHPLLTVSISEGQIQRRSRLILRGDGFGEWKALFVFAKQHGSPLQDPLLSIGLFLLLPQVTLPEYFFSCCTVMCLTLTGCCKSPLSFTCATSSERYQGPDCDGVCYTVTGQAISIFYFSTEAHPLGVIKKGISV